MPPRYLLVVVTHGRSPHLPAVLEAFREHVNPRPVHGLLWVDGPDVDDAAFSAIAGHGIQDWTFTGSAEQRGFCATYADAWQEAVEVAGQHGCDHVFWLEADFIVQRPVVLDLLAHLLAEEPGLAQVALIRNAVNEAELAAGGLVESRPGEFEPQSLVVEAPHPSGEATAVRLRAYPWLRQRSYFTTNPSLMTVGFMAEHPWPSEPDAQCEGLYGIGLREAGYDFAAWGDGQPWVEHVGVRTGFGY